MAEYRTMLKAGALTVLKSAVIGGAVGFSVSLVFQYITEVIISGRDFSNWASDSKTWKQAAMQGMMGAVTGGVGGALGAGLLSSLGKAAVAVVVIDAILDIGLGTIVDIAYFGDDPDEAFVNNLVGYLVSLGAGYAGGKIVKRTKNKIGEVVGGRNTYDAPRAGELGDVPQGAGRDVDPDDVQRPRPGDSDDPGGRTPGGDDETPLLSPGSGDSSANYQSRADEFRRQNGLLPFDPQTGTTRRNVAIIDYDVDGMEPGTIIAVSGQTQYSGAVRPVPEELRHFDTGFDEFGNPRMWDAEPIGLEHLTRRIGPDNHEARGTVTLFTERFPCTSCGGETTGLDGVIERFRARYPNIDVIVISTMPPPKERMSRP